MADSQRKTANLWDEEYTGISNTTKYKPVYVGDGTFTMSSTVGREGTSAVLYFLAGNVITGAHNSTNSVYDGQNRTQTAIDGYVTVAYRSIDTLSPENYNTMLSKGSIALPYWQHSLRKLATATEAVENPLYSDGTAITSYTIKGNTVQNGTPTPSNPVDVNGVGVRTENLLSLADVSTQTINGIEFSVNAQKGTVTINGTAILNQDTAFNIPIDSTLIGDFYVSGCPDGGGMSTYDIYVWDVTSRARCRKWDGTSGMESVLNASQSEEIQLLQGHDNILRIRVRYGIQFDNLEFKPMIRIPTAPSDFKPYGYKIPILSGGVTTNIYLGSTQTVRQVKKLVLTGQEDWNQHPNIAGLFRLNKGGYAKLVDTIICICSHYQGTPTVRLYSEVPDKGTTFYAGTTAASNVYYIRDSSFSDVETFKSYLAGQYSNGTPVTVWYVLQTATTGTVNEPLMKIGTYADTLSNAVSIPTTEGANSITVDTTVQPSEFTATWTGWHDAEVKEKSENLFDYETMKGGKTDYYLDKKRQ